MSYRRARESGPEGGSASVTVCTNHVALVDLIQDSLPAVVPQALGDDEALVAQVVELEHERVALAAVYAGMRGEEHDEIRGPLQGDGLASA